ncbi:uncharacterized protein LOC144513699 isoform X1 [Sander vitreus]
MSWVKQRYRDITPVTLQVAGGAVSATLYCGEPEGLAGGLVESFLVELYRCKLCQFTCSLKASVSSHLRTHLTYLGGEGGGGAQDGEGAGPYPLELNQEEEEEKRSDEDEDFLLYNMLDDMSPPTCDISSEGGLQVAHTCEVTTLFEEEAAIFPLKGGSGDLSCPMDPPATQEQMAQSAHLMTLGLCRISAAKPCASQPLPPQPDAPAAPLPPGGEGGALPAARRRRARDAHTRDQKKKKTFRNAAARNTRQQTPSDGWRSRLIGRAGSKRTDSQSVTEKKKKRPSRKKEGEEEEEKETGFCCSLCHRKFSTRLTLQRHRGTHGGEKPFSCHHCSYSSRLKASLLQHLRTHTGEKPYRCAECPYASIDRSSLLRHSRTHSQERPYSCQHCDYTSIQKKSLDLHARRHHTGEAFPCQQCEYSSPDRQLLLRHIRRHHATMQHATP